MNETSKQVAEWGAFSSVVRKHIVEYVIPQYGDVGNEPAQAYTEEDCIKHAQRYLARSGRQSRKGEELLDLIKAAHWIQKAHNRIAARQPTLQDKMNERAEAEPTHYANRGPTGAIFVKETSLFRQQGGLHNEWGLTWIPIFNADSIGHARSIAIKHFEGEIQIDKTLDEGKFVQTFERVSRVLRDAVPTDEKRDEEDKEMIRIAISGTIRALGGDPDAFVTEHGCTVLDVVVQNVAFQMKREEHNANP